MKRTLAPLALLLAAGCGLDNFASVQFFEICYPPAPTTDGVCVYPSSCNATLLGRPLVNVSAAFNLELPIQVNNQLKSNADASTGRVNTNDAHVEKYTITYGVPGVPLPGSVALANDTVPANGNTVVLLEVLPNTTVQQLSTLALPTTTTIVAEVVASGRYDNGSTFETGPYKVALDISLSDPAIPTANLCPSSGTAVKVFAGGCPYNAVQAGVVVALPLNYTCQ